MDKDMRIPGYDEYKIGDEFRVPADEYNPNENIMARILAGLPPQQNYKYYIRLSDGDKEINPASS